MSNSRGGAAVPARETAAGAVAAYLGALDAYLSEGREQHLRLAEALMLEAISGGSDIVALAAGHMAGMLRLLQSAHDEGDRAESAASCPRCSAARTGVARALKLEKSFAAHFPLMASRHRALQRANNALTNLADTYEQEALRISRSLHDESAQLLAGVHLALERLSRTLSAPQAREVADIRQELTRVEHQVRAITHELHPAGLDEWGLEQALSLLIEGVVIRWGLKISVDYSLAVSQPLHTQTAIYRMVQEGLNNVCRHAHATTVAVRVREGGGELLCSIEDDGIGCDTGSSGIRMGLGLRTMSERFQALGGELLIASTLGRGTILTGRIPLSALQKSSGGDATDHPAGR
jgi:signal transduction histidine kinase